MTTLYQLAAEYQVAAAKLSDLDLDEQTVADTLEGLAGEFEEKAVGIAMLVRNLETTTAAIKSAEDDMQKRRKSLENRIGRIKSFLLCCMQSVKRDKIESPYFVLSVRKNQASVEITDMELIPREFLRFLEAPPPEPDKKAIKAAIENKQEVPGAKLNCDSKRLEIK